MSQLPFNFLVVLYWEVALNCQSKMMKIILCCTLLKETASRTLLKLFLGFWVNGILSWYHISVSYKLQNDSKKESINRLRENRILDVSTDRVKINHSHTTFLLLLEEVTTVESSENWLTYCTYYISLVYFVLPEDASYNNRHNVLV